MRGQPRHPKIHATGPKIFAAILLRFHGTARDSACPLLGTFETCRPTSRMSANRGIPEVVGRPPKWRDWPQADMYLRDGSGQRYAATPHRFSAKLRIFKI